MYVLIRNFVGISNIGSISQVPNFIVYSCVCSPAVAFLQIKTNFLIGTRNSGTGC